MPVEVGVGYVSIVPETRGFGRLLDQQLSGDAARVGDAAGRTSGQGFLGGMGGVLKAGIAGLAAGAGALFAAGFAKAVEQDKSNAKLAAQLGLNEQQSARLGKVAGSVYAKGYGESVDQVNEALKALAQNSVVAVNAPKKDLAGLSKAALNLSETFGVDVSDSARAAGQMIRTGMAKDATQAFDLLTRGYQSGADKAGDLADTVNEYSTQFRKLGLDGGQALGLVSQALANGARDSDVAADALKEFSIRAVDGSKTTADGFKMIGLNASDMAARIGKGGTSASTALDLTLDKLRGIEDPVKRSQAAVALFGTQAEDLGDSLYSMDPSKATAALGSVGGAADKMGKTLHNTASNNIEVFKRQALQGLANVADKYALPALSKFGGFLNQYVLPPARVVGGALVDVLVPAVKATGSAFAGGVQWAKDYGAWLLPLGIAIGGIAVVAGASTIGTWAMTAAFTVYRGVILATTAVTRGWAVAQGILNAVMSANPVGLIIVGILALGAALVVAYQKSETFRAIVQGAWQGIQTAASVAWNSFLKPALSGIWSALQAVGTAASWLWSTVLSPVFSFIGAAAKVLFAVVVVAVVTPIVLAFKALGAVAGWLWNNAIGPAFRGIVALASWWWAGVKVYFGLAKAGVQAVGAVAMWLYRNAVQPAFRGIVSLASWWWAGVKVYFNLIKAGIRAVGAAGTWLWKNAIQPAFRGIGAVGSWLWNKALKPVFDAGKRGVSLFGGAFRTAKDAISKAWSQVSKIAAKPVNFIIEFVYTKGIKAVWDKVAGFVGLGKLPKAPKLLAAGGTVGDEWGAARPMKVNRPTAIVGEGDPRHPEYVIPTDPKFRGRARALWEAAGHQLMADGGVIGKLKGWGSSAVDWTVGKAKKIGGAVMDGVDFLAHPGKLWDKATKFIRDKIAKIGQSRWAQVAGKIPLKMLTGLKDKVVSAAKSAFDFGGGGSIGGKGVKRWSSVVLQALKLVGQPASLLPTVLRRMNQESGGNPKAINNWDINARNGVASRGLMQVIPPTFAAYAGRLRGRGIWDPLANIYASMRYALSRYGSLSRAYNRPGGYAAGGRPRPGELAWVGEHGPELMKFGGGARVWDSRTSLGGIETLTTATSRLADEVGAARVAGLRTTLSQATAARTAAASVTPVAAGQQSAPAGLHDGQQLALVLADGTQLDAYVDTRVDAGLTTARQRSRAGVKGR
ncbi:phage tail tape measure protein [Streptomyces indicus]|uniref:Phage-related minor tail protein n=1 Tax=Streptomyces indicus TaxID=417292 RepID=A0A1G9J736_9ACTN|nr:phage tail tape measure protein [Streptomyces indicus]SDL32934.1 Phage-related minor tail protein [Streptomyces indicus]